MRARMSPHVHMCVHATNFDDLCQTRHVKSLANERATGWPGLDDHKSIMSSPYTQHRDDIGRSGSQLLM